LLKQTKTQTLGLDPFWKTGKSGKMRVRIRLASGQKTVELVPTDTVGDLKEHACSLAGCTAVTILLGCVGFVGPHTFGFLFFASLLR
jgi:hypothetical protein